MPDPNDFSMLAAMGGQQPVSGFAPQGPGEMAPQGFSGGSPQAFSSDAPPELTAQLEKMRGMQAQGVARDKEAAAPPVPQKLSFSTSPDGAKKVSVDMSQGDFEAYVNAMKFQKETLGAFHQEAERLKAQEQQIRNQPAWVRLATTLSANMAQQKNMPGWVQGLGQTAAQLNPSAEQVGARRLQVLGQQAGVAQNVGQMELQKAQMDEQRAQRVAGAGTAADNQRRLLVEKARDNVAQSISKGVGTLDTTAVTSMMTEAGATPKETAAILKDLTVLSKNVGDAYKAKREDEEKSQKLAQTGEDRRGSMTTALLRGMAANVAKKTDIEKGIEAAAQSLAAGELTSIKDIASLRGDQRLAIFARARELNPKFSVGEIKRKIDTEQAFTVGKDGQALQSFGTFLQHAGEVTETLKGVEQSNVPAFNKPMNWWKKNMIGTPEYQRLLVSLEPVGKEFESFLLNGRALYADDRTQIKTMLSGDSSPKQILAALNQMGKTAKDRYVEMNHRYKRVMGQDIENPFGGEAIAGATKIGIALPAGNSGDATTSGPAPGARDAGGPRQKVTGNDPILSDPAFLGALNGLKPGKAIKAGGKFYIKGPNGQPVEVAGQ